MAMLDPIASSRALEKSVTKPSESGLLRKYYRFRPARFYGGIATGDAVGCNLNCAFCWVNEPRKRPQKYGEYYSAAEAARKLEGIARDKGLLKLRISGAEPTIGKEHLLGLLDAVDEKFLFVLETNGILLGHDEGYSRELARGNVHVRVALKGASREEFAILTNARPEFYDYQLNALENLRRAGASYHAAVMSFTDLAPLIERLRDIDHSIAENLEVERMFTLPHIEREMAKRRIWERLGSIRGP